MARTKRRIPGDHWIRSPKYKHKLLAGESKRSITTDRDDKPIAARKEEYRPV